MQIRENLLKLRTSGNKIKTTKQTLNKTRRTIGKSSHEKEDRNQGPIAQLSDRYPSKALTGLIFNSTLTSFESGHLGVLGAFRIRETESVQYIHEIHTSQTYNSTSHKLSLSTL